MNGLSVMSFLIFSHSNIAIVFTHLNGYKYCYLTLFISFNTIHALGNSCKYYNVIPIIPFRQPVKEFQVLLLLISLRTDNWFKLLCITKNSIKHQSFVYTLLNNQTVLFLTIHFNMLPLFAHTLGLVWFLCLMAHYLL